MKYKKNTKTSTKKSQKSQKSQKIYKIQKVKKKHISKKTKEKKIIKVLSNKNKESIITNVKKMTENQVIEMLLGGITKVKLWKVFLLNNHKEFTLKELLKLTKSKIDLIIEDLKDLQKIGIIKAEKKDIIDDFNQKSNIILYNLNNSFPLINDITNIMLNSIPRASDKVLNHLTKLPRLKTVILSGFFTEPMKKNNGVDILLIFEKVPEQVSEIIAELEYNLGKELKYAALDHVDFKYRHSIGDRLIRDVLDFNHVIAMDKMGFFR